MSTVPFAYHLYHKPTKQHYYGIRYKKGTSPVDLWVKYFSSSSVVHNLISEYGLDSFEVTIRKTFRSSEEALLWEHKFLTKIDAASKDNWINRHNGSNKFRAPIHHSEKTKEKLRKKITGIKRRDETKEKYRQAAIKREERRKEDGWKMPIDSIKKAITTRNERIETGVINPYSQERNAKMANSKKGTKRKYLPDGSFIMIKV